MRNFRVAPSLAMLVILVTLTASHSTQADPPLAPEHTHTCEPVEVAVVLEKRVQVKCDTPWTNPSTSATAHFFAAAIGTAGAKEAMSIALTAATSSKKVRVRFLTNSTGSPAGCDGDCRKLVSITLTN